jgi:hypothetical protein
VQLHLLKAMRKILKEDFLQAFKNKQQMLLMNQNTKNQELPQIQTQLLLKALLKNLGILETLIMERKAQL